MQHRRASEATPRLSISAVISSVYFLYHLRSRCCCCITFLCLHADRRFLKCARRLTELTTDELLNHEDPKQPKMSKIPSNQPTTIERQMSDNLDIPSRTVVVNNASELPNSYQMTPGGTMYSTTPGGTKIIYDRKFLLHMRNSAYSRTPPAKLVKIPDIIAEGTVTMPSPQTPKSPVQNPPENRSEPEGPFHFEIET